MTELPYPLILSGVKNLLHQLKTAANKTTDNIVRKNIRNCVKTAGTY